MIDSLKLKNYRGFKELELTDLKKINIIVGANNVGKTSILEAIELLIFTKDSPKRGSLESIFRKTDQRVEPLNYFKNLNFMGSGFDGFEISAQISNYNYAVAFGKGIGHEEQMNLMGLPKKDTNVISILDSNNIHLLHFSPKSLEKNLPTCSARTSTLDDPAKVSQLFGAVSPKNADGEAEIEKFMADGIDSRIKRLRYAPSSGGNHLIYVQLEGFKEMIPFTQFGQAFVSTLHLYAELYANEPDVMLVDEVENGIYYQGLPDYWKGLLAAFMARDTQLFATTHSFECMRAAHLEAKKLPEYLINFIRLDRDKFDPDEIRVTQFGEEEMDEAIKHGWDMR